MNQFFQWFFDGLGTFLVGLLLGGGTGSLITYRLSLKIKNKQSIVTAVKRKVIDKSKVLNKNIKIKHGPFIGRDNNG